MSSNHLYQSTVSIPEALIHQTWGEADLGVLGEASQVILMQRQVWKVQFQGSLGHQTACFTRTGSLHTPYPSQLEGHVHLRHQHYFPCFCYCSRLSAALHVPLRDDFGFQRLLDSHYLVQHSQIIWGQGRKELFFFPSSETEISPFEMSLSDICFHSIPVGGDRRAFPPPLFYRWGNRELEKRVCLLLAKKATQGRAGTGFHGRVDSDGLSLSNKKEDLFSREYIRTSPNINVFYSADNWECMIIVQSHDFVQRQTQSQILFQR